jgi:hypothetical protein
MTCSICLRRLPDRGLICQPCYQRLEQHLLDVQREAELLSPVPSMQQTGTTRGGTLASHRTPARVDVLTLTDPRPWTDSTFATLRRWATHIRAHRHLTGPEHRTIATERRLLSDHLDWATTQPWIDQLASAIRDLRYHLQRANGTTPEPPAGRCYLPSDSGPCNGPIWLDTANGHAHCGTCGQTWNGAQLAHLKWELDRARAQAQRPHTTDGRPYLTATELATEHHTTVNAIRIRLHRAGAHATGSHYHPDALQAATA